MQANTDLNQNKKLHDAECDYRKNSASNKEEYPEFKVFIHQEYHWTSVA